MHAHMTAGRRITKESISMTEHPFPAATEAAFVESINVGTPRTVDRHGREFATSIWKAPVQHRVAVRGINLAGDDQADRSVHGGEYKAVYAYGRDDLDWWSRELGRKLEAGIFGENLTIGGVHVSSALVGERWKIGTATFEVTQPRFPCFKLAAKMDDPHFVRRFAAAGRPGAYLRIVKEGEIGAGDTVEVVHRPDHEITMRAMAHIYLEDHDDAFRLRGLPGLPPEWDEWIDRRSRTAQKTASRSFEED
jgi:MOSC domain-containing protein YiiM